MPEKQLVEEYYLPRHPQLAAPFLRLGFSTTGHDLKDDYLVSAIGERMINYPRLPLISMTGSTKMGRRVGEAVAKRLGRSILELGGNNAVIVMDETTCMVRACTRIARFYHMESCGQCTPCREGTGWMHRMLKRIVAGEGREGDLELLRSAAGQIEGHTICAFGEAAAWPVQGFLRHYWDEFDYYVKNGRSMVDEQRGQAA